VAPLDGLVVPTSTAASGVDPAFETRPDVLADPDNSGAAGFVADTPATDVSLKLMLKAPLPQSTSPLVKMNDKVLDGVELQFPPGI
jgi:hypothetical protein